MAKKKEPKEEKKSTDTRIISICSAVVIAIAMQLVMPTGFLQFGIDVLVIFVLMAGIFKLLEIARKYFKTGEIDGIRSNK